MPAARGTKRTSSKASASTASSAPKSKKKRGIQLEIPTSPKSRGYLFTCGQGDVGQLGLGEDVIETTKFKQVSSLGDAIVDACAGGMHTVALDKDGKIWTFGCNDEGALGRPTSGEAEEGKPGTVLLPKKAVAISAGDSHSAALLENGDVYAWGSFRDSHGSMGLVMRGREGKACQEPVKVDIGESAAAIASGGDHLVVLSTSGSVYTMGCGEQGQLGRLSQRSASRDARQGFSALLVPSKVTLKTGASRVWAGYHATFALEASGEKMFAWGLNNYGQLGITGEKRKEAIFLPLECEAFNSLDVTWQSVACGQHHSLALDTNGQVYSIGRCEYGRLGLGDKSGDAEALEPVPKLQDKQCVSIAAGTSNSFAVTDTGEVFAWGMGSEGQLGTGKTADCNTPQSVDVDCGKTRAKSILAGGQHTVLRTAYDKEPTPEPVKETVDQEVEEPMEQDEEEEVAVPEKGKKLLKGRKRQKKQDQEDEVSSTSTAQPSDTKEESKPPKVNGDDKKETAMEIDETDKITEDKDSNEKDKASNEKDKDSHEKDKEEIKTEESTIETENQETKEKSEPNEESTPETKESLSLENTESDTKTQESAVKPEESVTKSQESEEKTEDKVNDIEMKEDESATVNGTEETPVVETKTVEGTIPPATKLATTA